MAYWWLVPFVFLAPKKKKQHYSFFVRGPNSFFLSWPAGGFFFSRSGFDHKMKGIYTERLGGGIGGELGWLSQMGGKA